MDGPFIGTEALAQGLATKRTLSSRYQMVHRNVYVPRGFRLTAETRAVAAWLASRRLATVAGLSAAALHGALWIDDDLPAELIRNTASYDDGIVVHRETLHPGEQCVARGVPATTPARTAFDLGRRKGLTRAVIRVDALANATRLTRRQVEQVAESHRGARGIVQLREVVELMDAGAESPQETRTRLLLIRAGLPKPTTQIRVPPWRIDMGYEDCLVGVEYDGPQHWTVPARRTADIEKAVEVAARGWRTVHVNNELLRYRPHVVVARVCDALRAAGCPWLADCSIDPRFLRRGVA